MFLQKPVMPDWKKVLLGFLLLALAVLVLDVGCIFRRITGIPCPGCGMTRACLAAMRLDFHSAFFYHPLWFLPAPLVLGTIFFPGGIFVSQKAEKVMACVLLALVLGVYAVRMLLFFPDTPPMEYQSENLLYWLASLAGLV